MEGERGVWYSFRLPISVCGLVAGICVFVNPIVTLASVAAALGATIFFKHAQGWSVYFFGALVVGALRHMAQDFLPTFIAANPFLSLRTALDARIASHVHGPEYALLSGILFGGSHQFSQHWRTVFTSTGTMHIVAVSGANISFYAVSLMAVLKCVGAQPRTRVLVCVTLLSAYIAATGAPASVVRAGVMALCAFVAPLIGRRTHGLHLLCAAAGVMLLISPAMIRDIGFQLSCLATLGLLVTGEEPLKIANSIRATCSAMLFVLPLESLYFGKVSISALIANILVEPLIPFIMVGGIATMSADFIGLAAPVAWIVEKVLGLMLRILEVCASLPGAVAPVQITETAAAIVYSGLAVFVFFRYRQQCR